MVQSTHDVRIYDDTVVKRFMSWDNGEPDREWSGLTLLDRWAPGLAAKPIARRVENGSPVVVMSRLPGEPLGDAPLTSAQLPALGQALHRMYTAVPEHVLLTTAQRNWGPVAFAQRVKAWLEEPHQPVGSKVQTALRAGAAWLDTSDADDLASATSHRVFGSADGNLGNFLWNGQRCYIVDFEDSGVTDPAYEVADLVEHVSCCEHA